MLLRAMVRGTSEGLVTIATQAAQAIVVSSRDQPVQAGATPKTDINIYVDEESHSLGSAGEPKFRTHVLVTVEIVVEADSRPQSRDLLDSIVEIVKNALLGGQGFPVTIDVTNGSAIATPDPALLSKIYPGMLVSGAGIDAGGEFVAVLTKNNDGTITLTAPYPAATGSWRFVVGSFVALFEEIDTVKHHPDYQAGANKKHLASDTIEIRGHVTEEYQPVITDVLNGITVYVDSVNIFDPNGTFAGEPFATGIKAAPRTSGPDGRPESTLQIDTPS